MGASTSDDPADTGTSGRFRRPLLYLGIASLVAVAMVLLVRSLSSGSSFDDVSELIDALNDGGVTCTRPKVFDTEDQGLKSGRCYVSGGEYEIDIYIFEDEEQRDLWLRNLKRMWPHDILVGDNWFLTTGNAEVTAQAQRALGGRIDEPRRES